MTPVFLELDEVLDVHADQIERYGGSAGVRDLGLLESAVATPGIGSAEGFFHADIYEMAAAYLFHIVKDHPFIDGNKRTGAMTAYVFLRLNGLELTCSNEALAEEVIAVAEGREDKAGIADFFRRHVRADERPLA